MNCLIVTKKGTNKQMILHVNALIGMVDNIVLKNLKINKNQETRAHWVKAENAVSSEFWFVVT